MFWNGLIYAFSIITEGLLFFLLPKLFGAVREKTCLKCHVSIFVFIQYLCILPVDIPHIQWRKETTKRETRIWEVTDPSSGSSSTLTCIELVLLVILAMHAFRIRGREIRTLHGASVMWWSWYSKLVSVGWSHGLGPVGPESCRVLASITPFPHKESVARPCRTTATCAKYGEVSSWKVY